ncbi:DUF6817 domain-containing protein [Actinophytocola oryzae]|uniref:DUF6817 domain-containing protein n=1 Tax=Actinophytocola oryzae TaxID=502181 RepID=A0A4R7UZI9_9PSEU|nr:hypothetical protein [Actinophytocola oryzae]TDV40965.1 hypothetical protein CLV71_12131 [Actinophytocola oryzae]
MDTATRAAVTLLRQRGAAELPHPGGTLLAHLERVYETLRSWQVPDPVALAGLTHAAYGTDGFPEPLLAVTERPVLRAAIGEDAERIVYAYGGCDRGTVYPRLSEQDPVFHDRFTGLDHRLTAGDLRAFADITAANEIDVVTHNPDVMREAGDALWRLFNRMRDHLGEPAWQACVTTFAPQPDPPH